jgi:hypothetical protein
MPCLDIGMPHGRIAARTEEYWDWVAVVLFLLLTVDMLLTMYAAATVGSAGEANPLMHWALQQGLGTLVVLNLLVLVCAVGLFYWLSRTLEHVAEPYDTYLGVGVDVWLGLLVMAGLALYTNNLAVIVFEQSLF